MEQLTEVLFVYGGLMHRPSLLQSLRQPRYSDANVDRFELIPAILHGWQRSWNVCLPTSLFEGRLVDEDKGSSLVNWSPRFLGVASKVGASVQGALCLVGKRELEILDENECVNLDVYERQLVSSRQLTFSSPPLQPIASRFWLYVPTKDTIERCSLINHPARIQQGYWDVVEEGLYQLHGLKMTDVGLDNTMTPPRERFTFGG